MNLEQIFNPPLTEDSTGSFKKIGLGVSEKMSFRGVAGWMATDDK